MVTAYNLEFATGLIERCKEIVKREMPNGFFCLKGIDNKAIYFNVIAKLNEVTENQMRDIKAKTYFYAYEETTESNIYRGSFIVNYTPSDKVEEGSAKELFAF